MRREIWRYGLLVALAGCGGEADGAPAADNPVAPEPEARRVWAGSEFNFYLEDPSPDGRHLTDVDWTTGDLAVRDLETGELRRVTDKGDWSESGDYAEFGVFSPDGSRIAYSWFKGRLGRPDGTQEGYELRSIGVDGGDMRLHIPARGDVRYIAAEDWSPDGSTLLVTVARQDRTSQLGLVSLDDDGYQILKSTDWRAAATAAFSRDGRWIAYDFPPDPESRSRDVFALAVDGSREIPLVEGPGHERLLGWLPDGSGILFHRETADSRAIWRLRVRDGRPVGAPELVKSDVWSIHPFGFSKDAFFYGVDVEQPQVHVAMVDLEAGRALSDPQPVASISSPTSRFAAWSPDGQSLAYIEVPFGNGDEVVGEVVVRSLSGEIVKRLVLPLQPSGRLEWLPGGLIVAGTDFEGEVALWRIDLETGGVEALVREPEGNFGKLLHYAVSPDLKTVFFRRSRTAQLHELVAQDVATGVQRVLAEVGSGRRMSVSADGELLAFWGADADGDERGMWVVPTEGGQPRLIHRFTPERGALGNHGALPFTPDGRHVLWIDWDRSADQDPNAGLASARRTLWKVAVDGSGATPVTEFDLQGGNLALSPDGRRIAFEGGSKRGEIWRLSGIEGFGEAAPGEGR